MTQKPIARGLARGRHGRSIRRPLPSKLFRPGEFRVGNFNRAVNETADYLRQNWPAQLSELRIIVLNVPTKATDQSARWAFDRKSCTVYLYKLLIEQFDARRENLDLMTYVEMCLFEAAAAMLEIDPHEFMHPSEDD